MPRWEIRIEGTPPRELLPNRRNRHGGHYLGRQAANAYRRAVCLQASAARNRAGMPAPVFAGPVRARVTVAWERHLAVGARRARWEYRRKVDPDNLDAALKPLWDGLQDAGVIANDRQLVREPVAQTYDPDGAGYVLIELSEVPDA